MIAGPLGNALGSHVVLSQLLKVGVVALPASIGVGILKYRLYDINKIISRTLAYGIVTGLLAGLYAGWTGGSTGPATTRTRW